MHEDSYVGAVRRLRELEHTQVAPSIGGAETRIDGRKLLARMRDLEDLALLACDENERLERELAAARRVLAVALADNAKLRAASEVEPPKRRRGLAIGAGLLLGLAIAACALYAGSIRSAVSRMSARWRSAPASVVARATPAPISAPVVTAIEATPTPAARVLADAAPTSLSSVEPTRRGAPPLVQRAHSARAAAGVVRCDDEDPLCGLRL